MILLFIALISIIGIISGKFAFKKWINPLTLYCIIWGTLVLLYEVKLLPYVDIIPMAWFYIISAFLSFLFGILTVINSRNLNSEKPIFGKEEISLNIFNDKGKALKYSILFFSVVCLLIAILNWMVLIKMFGSVPAVLINASTVYKLNTQGHIKENNSYISSFGYVAIFFAGVYAAYKGRFSLLTFFPFVGIVIKELATVGRAGMLLALMEFLFSFLLFRNLLKNDLTKRFKFSKKNAIIALSILVISLIVSASLVRITRNTGEKYSGASKELRQLNNNLIISPSIYLYFSSDIGVLSQYLKSAGESTKFGENTFLLGYDFLAKIGVGKRPPDFQKGYHIPYWTNTGTYIREIHADFGAIGVFVIPYLIGLITTWFWFKFYEGKNLIVFAFLVYLYLIIGFSFLVMITRLVYWVFSLIIIVIYIPVLEKIASYKYEKP